MGETDICNRALLLMGNGRGISSMGEASPEAALCRRVYKPCIDSLFGAHPWNWARRICTPALKSFTVPGWSFLYEIPTDSAMVRRLFTGDEANAPFEVLSVEEAPGHYTPAVASNISVAYMEYLSKDASERRPALFEEALAYRLAMEICVALKGGDINMREHLAKFYNEAVQRAIWNDANERVDIPAEWCDEYIRARG